MAFYNSPVYCASHTLLNFKKKSKAKKGRLGVFGADDGV